MNAKEPSKENQKNKVLNNEQTMLKTRKKELSIKIEYKKKRIDYIKQDVCNSVNNKE